MRVLIACEYSGRVRDAFLALGHDAMSCDLLPTDVEGPHHMGDVTELLRMGWDLMIGHPPDLISWLEGFGREKGRKIEKALRDFKERNPGA